MTFYEEAFYMGNGDSEMRRAEALDLKMTVLKRMLWDGVNDYCYNLMLLNTKWDAEKAADKEMVARDSFTRPISRMRGFYAGFRTFDPDDWMGRILKERIEDEINSAYDVIDEARRETNDRLGYRFFI